MGRQRSAGFLAFFLMATFLIATAASAQDNNKYNITAYEKAVCFTDAVRFCRQHYPDQDSLIQCMKANRDSLSSLCRSALLAGLKKRHMPL